MNLPQAWPPPSRPRPIVIIGAGAIVRTAHLPVYRKLSFPVAGIFDIDPDTARETARMFDVRMVFRTLREACSTGGAVFDVAVPGDSVLTVLGEIPAGAPVLIQKPMGEDLQSAREILHCCRQRQLVAAVNFQLRFSPNMLALRHLIARGALGTLTDIEVRIVDRQPWPQWPFLERAQRLEVLYHSIHYLDAVRAFAGEPSGVHCRAIAHPELPQFRDTRSSIILDYGDAIRCSLTMNHTHGLDERHRASFLKVEGTSGAAVATMGVNLNYPSGAPDRMEVALDGKPWTEVPLRGSWFVEAFEGPMSNLQRFVAGEDEALVSPVDDAIKTMALVEACYASNSSGSTPVPPA